MARYDPARRAANPAVHREESRPKTPARQSPPPCLHGTGYTYRVGHSQGYSHCHYCHCCDADPCELYLARICAACGKEDGRMDLYDAESPAFEAYWAGRETL